MKMQKLLKWIKPSSETGGNFSGATNSGSENQDHTDSLGKLVYLDTEPHTNPSEPNIDPAVDVTANASPPPIHFKGLMNVPELRSFFEENFYGYGRHAGSLFRTQETLDLGRKELIARFTNTLDEVAERKQSKLDRLQSEMIAIEGLSPSTSKQLQLACNQTEREIVVLKEQIEKCIEGKGWVLEALNRYQIGFHKGMREAIEFEVLAD